MMNKLVYLASLAVISLVAFGCKGEEATTAEGGTTGAPPPAVTKQTGDKAEAQSGEMQLGGGMTEEQARARVGSAGK